MLEKAGVFMLLFEDIKIPSGWVQIAPEVVGPGQAETCLFPVSLQQAERQTQPRDSLHSQTCF